MLRGQQVLILLLGLVSASQELGIEDIIQGMPDDVLETSREFLEQQIKNRRKDKPEGVLAETSRKFPEHHFKAHGKVNKPEDVLVARGKGTRYRSSDKQHCKQTTSAQDTPFCGYGIPACECNKSARSCTFNLVIDEIRTFASYPKLSVNNDTRIAMRGAKGVIFSIDENGTLVPHRNKGKCSKLEDPDCTDPQFVDGKTYRLAIAVNGQIPGPTLIVHEGQEVLIHVHNDLTSEGISIHWHGMHQMGTPWMDGVGQVTQCQIGPSSSFSYRYTAKPSGTFWYHSHSGAQRTDGLFGALVVKEDPSRLENIEATLGEFEDLSGQHTLTLIDWQHEASLDFVSQATDGLGFYPEKPLGEVPTPEDKQYSITRSFDHAGIGPVPYFSGLINGKGRHSDVPYNKTRLSIFTVEEGKTYRFRLVGAQGLYAYKFSIAGHKLTMVATDGYLTEPIRDVDYIIIHTGERYDFLLQANNPCLKDYWMQAETLESNNIGEGPPYKSLGHVAEGILHYKQSDDSDDPDFNVPSWKYEAIKRASPLRNCSSEEKCIAVNCPFKEFNPSYHIRCINVHELRLLEPTPATELPNAEPDPNCTHFINFNFEGQSNTGSANGRNFILPAFPPQTQNRQFYESGAKCDHEVDCNPSTPNCSCAHVIDIETHKTIQLVFTSVGNVFAVHPIHLHGHSFHVVHIGYPDYDSLTGFIASANRDISCEDTTCTNLGCDPNACTRPHWKDDRLPKSFEINSKTVRKDTVMVPAGGYVVINFLSDNPGYWFLHCHIELHQIEGMAMIIREGPHVEHGTPPNGMFKCGDFEISESEFHKYRFLARKLKNH